MTRILHVSGGDYAAMIFERQVEEGKITAEEMWADSNNMFCTGVFDMGDGYFEYTALEFGEVDPEFITWVRDGRDYDHSKHENFYVMEEAK